ncbi:MAG: hypothetical protein EPO40_02860 [Myxococcaceae bacterium]|nr:MAG: hypothetical protein EPO40_02860 [Myxococcaceae bacterium]
MTPEEHLAEADRLIEEASDMTHDEAVPHLTFAQFHIQIAQAAAALGVRHDLGRYVDLAAENERERRAVTAAAAEAQALAAEQ